MAAFLSVIGITPDNAARAWWIALIVGLCATVPTALTGLADWLTITRGTPLWRTATFHLGAMVTATVLFLIAALVGHGGYEDAAVKAGPFVVTLAGFAMLTLGGWLGGTIVYVHGMRVLALLQEPTSRAVSPMPKPEKEFAERA